MNPLLPTPDALPIPGPAPLFTGLLHLTFVVSALLLAYVDRISSKTKDPKQP